MMGMNRLNERGYTLVITLLTIVLIFTFSTVLITVTVNSAIQINKSEDDVQTTHLAEMGLEYFKEVLTYTILNTDLSGESTIEDAKLKLEQQLQMNIEGTIINPIVTPSVENNHFYEFQVDVESEVNSYYKVAYKFYLTTIMDSNNNTIEVIRLTYRLTSGNENIVETQPYEMESKDFTWVSGVGVGLPGSTPSEPVADDPDDCGVNNPCNVYTSGDILIDSSSNLDENNVIEVKNLYTEGNLVLDGTGKNSPTLKVYGDLYVGGTTTLDNHTVINVEGGNAYFKDIDAKPNSKTVIIGDAYFYGDDTGKLIGPGQSSLMCIEGTAHLLDTINIKEHHVNIFPATENCQNYMDETGIWAWGVTTFSDSTFPDPPEWTNSQPGSGGEIDLDPSYSFRLNYDGSGPSYLPILMTVTKK